MVSCRNKVALVHDTKRFMRSYSAIIAGPDEKWGERPYAFVILKQGHSLSEENVIEHCRKNLAGYKCPSKVIFTNNIPKTSTGNKNIHPENHCKGTN